MVQGKDGGVEVVVVAVALGVAVALVLRIREIGRGEEDDAKKY